MTWLALASAFWLGIMTSISPCPLAANIAAVSFIGRQIGDSRRVLLSGLLYTIGRMAAYAVLGMLVAAGLMAAGGLSRFLQLYMNEILGPVLILLGMVLLGMIGSALSFNPAGAGIQDKVGRYGLWAAAPVGALFAVSFCPVSAGLFFGALIPLILKSGGALPLLLSYGGGTALPVLCFACLIAFGGEWLGKAFHCLTVVERWVRTAAGWLFILAGVYYCLTHIYGI